MKVLDKLKQQFGLIETLKKIYVVAIYTNILYVYAAIRPAIPTKYISKETLDLAFWVGCTYLIVMLIPMIRFSMYQIRATILILFRMFGISIMIETTISILLTSPNKGTALISFGIAIANIVFFKKLAHIEAVDILLKGVDNEKRRKDR